MAILRKAKCCGNCMHWDEMKDDDSTMGFCHHLEIDDETNITNVCDEYERDDED